MKQLLIQYPDIELFLTNDTHASRAKLLPVAYVTRSGLHLLNSSSKDALDAFKAAKLFFLPKVCNTHPTASDVDDLLNFPFLSKELIQELKNELPLYLSKCANTDLDFCVLRGMKRKYLLGDMLQRKYYWSNHHRREYFPC